MKYLDYCYTCIFDDDFNIVWTDNNSLFRRLARRHEMLKKRLFNARRTDTVYYELTADKNKYLIKANLLPDRRIICRAALRLPESVLTNEELFNDVDNIRFSSLNAISMAQTIRNRIKNTAPLSVKESINAQIKQMTNVYSDCMNILQLFENESNAEWISLEKFLIHVFDRLYFSTRGIRKDISYCIMLHKPFWLLDYKHLETVIFNIGKLILILTAYGNGGMITIRSISDTIIRFTVEFSYQQNYPLCNCQTEMRVIRHLFELMDGEIDFFQEKDNVVLEGYICSESSYYISKVKCSLRYEPDLEFRDLRGPERTKSRIYCWLYKVQEHSYLRSYVEEFPDIEDPYLSLWRMIFEGAAERAFFEE